MADITVTFGNGTSHVYTGVPDTATPDQVQARAAKDFPNIAVTHLDRKGGAAAPTSAPAAPHDDSLDSPFSALQQGGGEALLNMVSGAVAKPVSDVMGLGASIMDTLGGADAVGAGVDPSGLKRSIQDAMTYTPKTQAGKAAAQYNPLALLGQIIHTGIAEPLGHAFDVAPGTVDVNPFRDALGSGVTEAVDQLPGLAGGAARAFAPQAADLLRGAPGGGAGKFTARGMMQSALKPTQEELTTGKAGRAIDTMLDNGLNVTRGGVDRMQATVDHLNTQIDAIIDSNPALRINKGPVRQAAEATRDRFLNQVNAADDYNAVQRVINNFMNPPAGGGRSTLSIRDAQEMKKGTYRQLEARRAYKGDDLKAAQVEGERAMASALREAIARAQPAVQPLNEAESQMLNALSLTERRVLMDANKNPAGLSWLTLNPVKFAGFMADRSPLFKSLIARMLNTGAENAQGLGSTAAAGGALTSAAAAGAPQNPTLQAQ